MSKELRAAIQFGRKTRARPGKDGSARWKFEHQGMAFITDASCQHEVTSWQLDGRDDDFELPPNLLTVGVASSHTILIVDHSGSMRKNDVPGYSSRTEAVYDVLAKDFVGPQLAVSRKLLGTVGAGLGANKAVVSLIEMSDEAEVVFERWPLDEALLNFLEERKSHRAASHGNYLPALEALNDLLAEDADPEVQLFIMFLSDGAPSDHTEAMCSHGVRVWGRGHGMITRLDGKRVPSLADCGSGDQCRNQAKQKAEAACLKQIRALGKRYSHDRVSLHTVAFGPPQEDYKVLQRMADSLPKSSFHKLGLTSKGLRDAFSTLTSTLTTLRTGSMAAMTLRTMQKDTLRTADVDANEDAIHESDGWNIYLSQRQAAVDLGGSGGSGGSRRIHPFSIVSRRRYNCRSKLFVDTPLHASATGVAVMQRYFSCGVERAASRCTEVATQDGVQGQAVGEWLVAKESVYMEQLSNANFHYAMAKLQAKAQRYAELFNEKLAACVAMTPAHNVEFLQCSIYEVIDKAYAAGRAWILAEPHLDGRWLKFNNNAGGVRKAKLRTRAEKAKRQAAEQEAAKAKARSNMGVIQEEDEEEVEEAPREVGPGKTHGVEEKKEEEGLAEVPQCFSHFTWSVTCGKKLICDLQGTWNEDDGFVLTDPVMHSLKKKNGPTDRGEEGMRSFFMTHTCGPLCRQLGLQHSAGAGGHGIRPVHR